MNPHIPTPNVDTLPITQQSVVDRDKEILESKIYINIQDKKSSRSKRTLRELNPKETNLQSAHSTMSNNVQSQINE